jgi:cold shock protein
MEEYLGEVAWFNDVTGYGFIKKDDGIGPDVFVHHSNILSDGFRTLKQGQKVKYSLGANHRGQQAINVLVIAPITVA